MHAKLKPIWVMKSKMLKVYLNIIISTLFSNSGRKLLNCIGEVVLIRMLKKAGIVWIRMMIMMKTLRIRLGLLLLILMFWLKVL